MAILFTNLVDFAKTMLAFSLLFKTNGLNKKLTDTIKGGIYGEITAFLIFWCYNSNDMSFVLEYEVLRLHCNGESFKNEKYYINHT